MAVETIRRDGRDDDGRRREESEGAMVVGDSVLMVMWQVSPVGLGPTMRFWETTWPVKGVLPLKLFTLTLEWSW